MNDGIGIIIHHLVASEFKISSPISLSSVPENQSFLLVLRWLCLIVIYALITSINPTTILVGQIPNFLFS